MGRRSKQGLMHAATRDTHANGQPKRPIPIDVQRHGTPLLNLQCWCWGWDIRRPADNVLLERGFTRVRPLQPHIGSSAYTLRIGAQTAVVLWGFGFFYGHSTLGGLYLSRQRFAPQLVCSDAPPSSVWDFNRLPPMHAPTSQHEWRSAYQLLILALNWIADYEAWVLTTLGTQYRHECFTAWRKTKLAAHELPAHWHELRRRLAAKLAAAEHTQPVPPAIST